ncbi:hypothetical protein F4703DRAFT_1133371 [Phycomyces blakesleeanus]
MEIPMMMATETIISVVDVNMMETILVNTMEIIVASMDGNSGRQYDRNSGRQYDRSDGGGNQNDRGHYQGNSGNNRPRGGGGLGGGGGNYQTFGSGMSIRGRGGSQQQPRFKREFIDNDIQMDTQASIAPGKAAVKISNYPPGSENQLLSFLQRKAKFQWEPEEVFYENDGMVVVLENEGLANSLCRLNNYEYRQMPISIQRFHENSSQGGVHGARPINNNPRAPRSRSNALDELLKERWDPSSGFLNLDELPKSRYPVSLVISRLLAAAQELFGDAVVTISFARNELWSVSPINRLPEFFPNILNLSLQDNDIAEFKSLRSLSSRLNRLTELLLIGNPIQYNNDWETYSRGVQQIFPSVKILDQRPISGDQINPTHLNQQHQMVLPTQLSQQFPPRPSFFDQDSSKQATEDFMSKYFPLFDSNRAALVDLYDAQATFSLNFSRTSCAHERWGLVGGRKQTLFTNEEIIKKFITLPPTIHSGVQIGSFITDAWQVSISSPAHPLLLFITIHGDVREATGLNGPRHIFERTFLIAPAPINSKAHAAGWQYIVITDSLILRDYTENILNQPPH